MTTPVKVSAPITSAIVPVAGLGTRLRPLTPALPKEMLPLGRRLLLDYVLEEMIAAGITEALFVVSKQKPMVRAWLGDKVEKEGKTLHCSYAVQHEQKGSGHALLCAAEWLAGRTAAVVFGDCLIESQAAGLPLARLIQTHRAEQAAASILVERVEPALVSRYGMVDPLHAAEAENAEPFALRGIVEKPQPQQTPSHYAAAARWVLEAEVLQALQYAQPDARGEINLPDTLHALMQQGRKMWAVPLLPGEARQDIGNARSYLSQFVKTALHDPEYGQALREEAALILKCNNS